MENLRTLVWKANVSLWKNGLVCGTQGNVSGIDRGHGRVLIKPSGVAYEDLTRDMLVEVDAKGRVVSGKWKPSVDTVHHLLLYRLIPGISGVCHTHSRYTCAFSVAGRDIPVLTTGHADVFGTGIPVTAYVDNEEDHIGKTFLKHYERTGCPAVVLGHHGVFAVGDSPGKAAFHAMMAEHCAEVAFFSFQLGKALGVRICAMPGKEVRKWYNRYHSERYGQKR